LLGKRRNEILKTKNKEEHFTKNMQNGLVKWTEVKSGLGAPKKETGSKRRS
jgi:hypothetical protein